MVDIIYLVLIESLYGYPTFAILILPQYLYAINDAINPTGQVFLPVNMSLFNTNYNILK